MKVLDKMKDQCAGVLIVEYAGVRPNMCSIKRVDDVNMRQKVPYNSERFEPRGARG